MPVLVSLQRKSFKGNLGKVTQIYRLHNKNWHLISDMADFHFISAVHTEQEPEALVISELL